MFPQELTDILRLFCKYIGTSVKKTTCLIVYEQGSLLQDDHVLLFLTLPLPLPPNSHPSNKNITSIIQLSSYCVLQQLQNEVI